MMKTIQELLELTKNPYYKFMPNEQAVLDDFLEKKQAKALAKSQKQNSKKSSDETPVVVKNVVQKAPTYPPQAHESVSDERKA